MHEGSTPDDREAPPGSDEELAALDRALRETPKGALALAGASVILMMLCWFAIYFLIFLPRGSVG